MRVSGTEESQCVVICISVPRYSVRHLGIIMSLLLVYHRRESRETTRWFADGGEGGGGLWWWWWWCVCGGGVEGSAFVSIFQAFRTVLTESPSVSDSVSLGSLTKN